MPIYFLDVAAPVLLLPVLLLFMFLCGVVEGGMLYLFRLNKFRKLAVQAMVINLITLVVGFAIMPFWKDLGLDEQKPVTFLPPLYLLTVLIEALLLRLYYPSTSWGTLFGASAVMNAATYIILAVIYTSG